MLMRPDSFEQLVFVLMVEGDDICEGGAFIIAQLKHRSITDRRI
jgi:hypothetical protein